MRYCWYVLSIATMTLTATSLAIPSVQSLIKAPQETVKHELSPRRRAQYDFIQQHLGPDVLEENIVTKQLRAWTKLGLTFCSTAAVAYIITKLIWYLPWINNEIARLERLRKCAITTKGLGEYAWNNYAWGTSNENTGSSFSAQPEYATLLKKIDEFKKGLEFYNTFFWSVCSFLFTFLSPLAKEIISEYYPDHAISYTKILNEYIKHWHEYKICTPKEFHSNFDMLYLCAQASGGKLNIDEDAAELFISSIVIQAIDATTGSEA